MPNFQFTSLIPNLMVKNVNQSIEFYEQTLGFSVVKSIPEKGTFDWAMLAKDDVMIMLHETRSMQAEYPEFKDHPTGGSVIFYTCVENIEVLYQNINDQSIICKPLHSTFYGKQEFSIQDPDHYVITFSEET